MGANQVFLVILVVATTGLFLLYAATIKFGLMWASVAEISITKALGLLAIFVVAGSITAFLAGIVVVLTSKSPAQLALDLVGVGSLYLAAAIVTALIYKVRFFQAAKAIVPFALASMSAMLLTLFVVRPFVYEAYVIPTNAMAPTLLGEHSEAPCPRCGNPAFGSLPDARFGRPPDEVMMICSNELTSVKVSPVPPGSGGGDHILASKLLVPRRWDLIVFRYPEDPTVVYVKRLVGLPGEKLEIRDNSVWIKRDKVEPPESIHGIRYSPTIEANGQVHSGPGSVPVQLGPDEYFVLGDWVDQSADSRMWQRGAPGHPPYAVPKENIVGVVINIYWPPKRWTSFL